MSFEFQTMQRAFTKRIRQGEAAPCPEGISVTRMQVYQRCFLNGISELLENCFPVLHSMLEEPQWDSLVQNFYSNYAALTPFFYEVPQEFLNFLLQQDNINSTIPFLTELAHYEWMELVIELSEQPSPLLAAHTEGRCLTISAVAEIVGYHYPVHKVTPDFMPSAPSPVYLCIYRDGNDVVHSIELDIINARLLQLLKERSMTSRAVLTCLANEMQVVTVEPFILKNKVRITHFIKLGVII